MKHTEDFPPPSRETVTEFADQLRQYAGHFAPRDWDYTRDTGDLVEIRYERRKYDRLSYRLKRAVSHLFGISRLSRRDDLLAMLGPSGFHERWIYAKVAMARDRNMPDGVLDDGKIITHWEEDGEYLQYVQPSVGLLVADWMDADPDNPNAIKVAGEMRRINARYGARLRGEI